MPMPTAPIPPDPELPERPERPDCCLGGCAVCVLDDYQDEVAAWERRVAEILAERERRRSATPD